MTNLPGPGKYCYCSQVDKGECITWCHTLNTNKLAQPEDDKAIELSHLLDHDPVTNRYRQDEEEVTHEGEEPSCGHKPERRLMTERRKKTLLASTSSVHDTPRFMQSLPSVVGHYVIITDPNVDLGIPVLEGRVILVDALKVSIVSHSGVVVVGEGRGKLEGAGLVLGDLSQVNLIRRRGQSTVANLRGSHHLLHDPDLPTDDNKSQLMVKQKNGESSSPAAKLFSTDLKAIVS